MTDEPQSVVRVRVSVVTVVYNGQAAIAHTIDSTLAQDYPELEVIVVDGGSTDGTQAVIEGYGAAIDRFVTEPDRGIYDAMNKGVRLASGEFILFMNSGDVFANAKAVSSAMRAVETGVEQLIFGSWIRQSGPTRRTLCLPRLDKGVFNHQALMYSRSIHRWHGDYFQVTGLTTADYLFFATLLDNPSVVCKTINATIAIIDVTGVSSGKQTLSQKHAIDFLCGRTNRLRLFLVIALHPLYSKLKRLIRPSS